MSLIENVFKIVIIANMIIRRIAIIPVLTGFLVFSFLSPLKPTFVWAQTTEQELFLVAQKAFEDGFYDVSIRYIEQYLDQYPKTDKRVQAKLLLGQCLFFKEQYLKAFSIFRELLQYTEYKDATLFWLGETYLKGRDYKEAEKQYRQIIDIYSESLYAPQAYYSLAWVQFEQSKFKEARDIFADLVEEYPRHHLAEDAMLKMAECEYNLGFFQSAAGMYQKYIYAYPTSQRIGESYLNMAEALYNLEEFADAIDKYHKADLFVKDPGLQTAAKLGQGWGHLKLGEYTEALVKFEEAVSVAQAAGISAVDALLGEASLFTERKEHEKAVEVYTRIVKEYPKSPRIAEVYIGRANTYYTMERYKDAVKEYSYIVEHFTDRAEMKEIIEKARFGLAWTYLKSGQIDKSIDSFKNVMEGTESKIVKVSALTQIGDAYQDANELEKAVQTYDRILSEFSESVYSDYVQYRQGIALLKLGKYDAANLSFRTLQSNYPNSKYSKDVTYYLGVSHFKRGNWSVALERMQEFIDFNNRDNELVAEANYILALSYFNLNKTDDAIKVFQKIIRAYPDDMAIIKNCEIGLAKSYYQTGDVKEALKRFKIIAYKYVQSDAEYEALLWLGQHYMSENTYDQAEKYYRQIVESFDGVKDVAKARYELGRLYHIQGEFDKALEEYRVISKKDIEYFAKAKLAIADIFSKEMTPSKTIETYNSIIDNSDDFKRDAYIKIAKVYRESRDYSKELEAYSNALLSEQRSSDVTNAELHFYMGDAYEVLNKPDKAIDVYLKIPYLSPNEKRWVVKAYLRIARLLENQERWLEAVGVYEKIVGYDIDESKFAQERMEWIRQNESL